MSASDRWTRDENPTMTTLTGSATAYHQDALARVMLPQAGLPLSTSPMTTAATWTDQQLLCGIPLDLRTPSLDDHDPAATDWNNAAWAPIAASSSTTPELAAPTHMPSFDGSVSRLPPQTLMGSSTAFPVTSRLRNRHAKQSPSDGRQLPPQSSVADGQGLHGFHTVQSASNMSALGGPLSECPESSGGTRPPTASKRNHDPNNERADSISHAGSQEDEKLKISRERNRIAAAKTRRKKKRSAKDIEERAREIEQTNTSFTKKFVSFETNSRHSDTAHCPTIRP
ncbi:hypothetical protein CERZMDRAFT_85727 [Cercospora zeae-maydis SCOH1-5]|uniref:BZIP domain-containing protein n=1 Tax=Cercospora zeae-maydis SCOH1-5 TaxID=717836 RepID=A0A6A6FCT2_9PEZI|nr:hypothetical protein CERZMDRAFT_85727 [Cercospora zeae-maydis SCOH1-5]